jgi:hypothetical protein
MYIQDYKHNITGKQPHECSRSSTKISASFKGENHSKVCVLQMSLSLKDILEISCASDTGFVPKFHLLQMPAIGKLRTACITHNIQNLLRSNVQGYGCKLTKLAPNQAVPNWIVLNRTMRGKTKACITKSWEICALVR